ncbi:hypothetical protein COY05_04910 [Candidatus Peregrinibacteria bacterium CG_4_10_14_0_2_um_filter_38_24]|nr:MAG: hypothetical protein COY05_04910 [Candidatus Peregrinibacteria bacterium CG_4_10_14_0_2_um_filter_38_24]PJC38495.1 MAG: hypothetical protein CO044_04700 [Candidatus Peregrinibacteria bacterium CG_4_9_14_0_2_um_filter_38_9]
MKIIEGQVVKGLGVGKKLGFPTMNILYNGDLSGVFAGKVFVGEKPKIVTVQGHEGHACKCGGGCLCSSEQNKNGFLSAIHIGKRLTLNVEDPILEAYIIEGFEKFEEKDISGRKIKVEIFEKIRDTKKFENLDELKKQIAKDVKDVGYFFKKNT